MKQIRKRKVDPSYYERWSQREEMHVSYEFTFKGHLVTPGMQFRIRGERTTFTFKCLVHNTKLDSTWVDCMTPEGFRAVRPEKITRLVGVKRSYKKKVAANA